MNVEKSGFSKMLEPNDYIVYKKHVLCPVTKCPVLSNYIFATIKSISQGQVSCDKDAFNLNPITKQAEI